MQGVANGGSGATNPGYHAGGEGKVGQVVTMTLMMVRVTVTVTVTVTVAITVTMMVTMAMEMKMTLKNKALFCRLARL